MSWLTRWFPQSVPLTKPSARRFRPRFEALEDRLAPTAAPTLDSPSGAASPTTAFTWEPVAGVNYYNFQLVDQTTNQTLQGPNLTLTTITLGSPLRLGDTYEWLVQAVDTSGVASAWSTLTFSVTNLVAPTLIGPTGAAAPRPTFSWTALADATHYDIWVQNQATNQIVRDQNVPGTSWVPTTPLAQGSAYVWWVRGIDANGVGGPWSSSLAFTEAVLPAPTLNGPSGMALTQPTFSWNLVPGADHYDVWLQDNTTAQVIRDTNVASTSWTPAAPLLPLNYYKWWVRPIDPNGYAGQWSNSLAFTAYALPTTTLIGPTGATTTLPTFSWNAVTGADRYDIYVQDLRTNQVLRDTNVASTTWVPANALASGDAYTWWVRALDGNGGPSQWSAPLTLTAYALPAPTLVGPGGSAPTLPTFSWNAATGADHYDIWLQDMSSGKVIRNTNVAGTSWTPSGPLGQGDNYTWWVRALDAANHASTWSAPLSFAVPSLASPAPIAPTAAAALLPTFSWGVVAGAAQYEVWLQDVKSGAVVHGTNVASTAWTASTPLTAGDSYKWWVRAFDGNNSPGPWSAAQTFAAYALAAPGLIGPGGTAPTLPTFTWNAVTGANHYDIWVTNMTTGQSAVLRNQDVVGTSWAASTPLIAGDSYRWWLRAVASSNMDSAWSASLDFTVASAS